MKIKELPTLERPYEKLELYGEKALSNAELLAIIIKTGTKEETSVQVAQKLLKLSNNLGEDLNFLKELSLEEITKVKGIGKIKAIQLKAVCELAKRMTQPHNYRQIQVINARNIYLFLREELRFLKREVVKIIVLNSKSYIVKIKDISLGSSNFASISTQEILNEAVKMGASRIILVHNHPSGDSTPSDKDLEITDKLCKSAKILGIQLLDHIIIGNLEYTSIYKYDLKEN